MLIKNFKRKNIVVSSTTGHTARFAPGQERDVPEILVDACIAKGLMPADDFQQAVREAAAEESVQVEQEEAEKQAEEAVVAQARAEALAQAAADAEDEAAKEKAEAVAAKKRSEAAKKAAATRKANAKN